MKRLSPLFGIVGVIVIILILVGILVGAGYGLSKVDNWELSTGFGPTEIRTTDTTTSGEIIENHPPKTLWDWLDLLIVPFSIAIAGVVGSYWLNRQNQNFETRMKEREFQESIERERDAALRSYFERMTELIASKNDNLRIPNTPENQAASALTYANFGTLGAIRNLKIVRFLSRAGLLSASKSIISLAGIDLSNMQLEAANFEGANLQQAVLTGSNLARANLAGADLSGAKVMSANLSSSVLSGSRLVETDLTKANLEGSRFQNTTLTESEINQIPDKTKDNQAYREMRSILTETRADLQNTGDDMDKLFWTSANDDTIEYKNRLTDIQRKQARIKADMTGINTKIVDIGHGIQVTDDRATNEQSLSITSLPIDSTEAEILLRNLENRHAELKKLRASLEEEKQYWESQLHEAEEKRERAVHTNLRGAILTEANLQNVYIRNADMSHTNLKNANLRGAILIKVYLSEADFTDADLEDAAFVNVTHITATELKQMTHRVKGAWFNGKPL